MIIDNPIFEFIPLTLVTCGFDNLNYTNTDEIIALNLNKYLCIKEKNMLEIGGVFTSNLY
jgi:hypothetical protein